MAVAFSPLQRRVSNAILLCSTCDVKPKRAFVAPRAANTVPMTQTTFQRPLKEEFISAIEPCMVLEEDPTESRIFPMLF